MLRINNLDKDMMIISCDYGPSFWDYLGKYALLLNTYLCNFFNYGVGKVVLVNYVVVLIGCKV